MALNREESDKKIINQEDMNIVINNFLNEKTKKQNDFQVENENIKYSDKTENEKSINKLIDNANTYFLIEILSPQLSANESKKREHKNQLIKIVKIFLIFQFLLLLFLLVGTLVMIFVFHALKNDLKLSYINAIVKFIGFYITSVVVELIAMLNYIVSNVFDTSITGLVELFKDATSNSNTNNKENSNKDKKEQESKE